MKRRVELGVFDAALGEGGGHREDVTGLRLCSPTVVLAAKCPSPGTCWNPGPAPAWVWAVYLALVVFAALVIFWVEGGRPDRRALAAWVVSGVLFGVTVAGLELYSGAIAPK